MHLLLAGNRRHAAALLLLTCAMLLACNRLPFGRPAAFVGTDLSGIAAPDFSLASEDGTLVSLHELQGKAIVLAFLYTQCPDLCPLTAEKMREAYGQLSADERSHVALLAISVDPDRDTPEARAAFIRAHRLQGTLRYLNGEIGELYAVWRGYAIGVDPIPHDQNAHDYAVDHNAVTYVIDPNGELLGFLHDEEYTPDQLAGDLRLALRRV
jgi:protein SCO1/2